MLLTVMAAGVVAEDKADTTRPADTRCGGYCLYVGLRALDVKVSDYGRVEQILGEPTSGGYSLQQLADCARQFGCQAVGVRTTLENLRQRARPFACIALLNEGHYVLVVDADNGQVNLVDPPRKVTVSVSAFATAWSGTALLLSPYPLEPEDSIAAQSIDHTLKISAIAATACCAAVLLAWKIRRGRQSQTPLALLLSLLTLTTIGCGSELPQTGSPGKPVPRIYVQEPNRNLEGVAIDEQDQLEVHYRLQNIGTAPLKINRLIQSCSCTRCELSQTVIPSNEIADLRVFVNEPGMGEERSVEVTIDSSDPSQSLTKVTARWRADPIVSFEPRQIDFGVVRPAQEHARLVHVRTKKELRARTELLSTAPGDVLRADWVNGDQRQAIQVSLKSINPGAGTGSAIVALGRRNFRLPIQWIVRDKIVVSPAAVMIDAGLPGERRLARVKISSDTRDALDISGCRLNGAHESTKVEVHKESDATYTVSVEMLLPEVEGIWNQKLVILCSAPEAREVEVPVSAIIHRRQ